MDDEPAPQSINTLKEDGEGKRVKTLEELAAEVRKVKKQAEDVKLSSPPINPETPDSTGYMNTLEPEPTTSEEVADVEEYTGGNIQKVDWVETETEEEKEVRQKLQNSISTKETNVPPNREEEITTPQGISRRKLLGLAGAGVLIGVGMGAKKAGIFDFIGEKFGKAYKKLKRRSVDVVDELNTAPLMEDGDIVAYEEKSSYMPPPETKKYLKLRDVVSTVKQQEFDMLRINVKDQFDWALKANFSHLMGVLCENYNGVNVEKTIRTEAVKQGFPPEWALAIATIENSGSFEEFSSGNCAGIFQMKGDVARANDLRVPDETVDVKGNTKYDAYYFRHPVMDATVDERLDPIKSTQGAMKEIRNNMRAFVDPLITVGNHNWGWGTTRDMISAYSNGEITQKEENPVVVSSYIKKNNLQFHQLLENPRVQEYIKTNRPGQKHEIDIYVYRAIIARLFWDILEKYRSEGKSDKEFFGMLKQARNTPQTYIDLLHSVGLQPNKATNPAVSSRP